MDPFYTNRTYCEHSDTQLVFSRPPNQQKMFFDARFLALIRSGNINTLQLHKSYIYVVIFASQ